jgi:hypothetical protein
MENTTRYSSGVILRGVDRAFLYCMCRKMILCNGILSQRALTHDIECKNIAVT